MIKKVKILWSPSAKYSPKIPLDMQIVKLLGLTQQTEFDMEIDEKLQQIVINKAQ